jgi:hypothetical protein
MFNEFSETELVEMSFLWGRSIAFGLALRRAAYDPLVKRPVVQALVFTLGSSRRCLSSSSRRFSRRSDIFFARRRGLAVRGLTGFSAVLAFTPQTTGAGATTGERAGRMRTTRSVKRLAASALDRRVRRATDPRRRDHDDVLDGPERPVPRL